MATTTSACVFSFGGGLSYDLSALAAFNAASSGTPFLANNSAAGDRLVYAFAFCTNLAFYGCRDGPSASFSLQPQGACVRSFGVSRGAADVAAPLTERRTDGISLTYGGGTTACGGQFGQGALTTLRLACAALPAPQLLVVDSLAVTENSCRLTYELRGPAGCGIVTPTVSDPVTVAALVFGGLVGALALYLVGGIAYKRRALGARGLEAVPHIDTWRRLFGGCAAACRGGGAGGSYKLAGAGGEADGAVDVDYALYDDPPSAGKS